ncbi:hypothetical protein T484DRAFT_1893575, partial [Baffinella frigidus]
MAKRVAGPSGLLEAAAAAAPLSTALADGSSAAAALAAALADGSGGGAVNARVTGHADAEATSLGDSSSAAAAALATSLGDGSSAAAAALAMALADGSVARLARKAVTADCNAAREKLEPLSNFEDSEFSADARSVWGEGWEKVDAGQRAKVEFLRPAQLLQAVQERQQLLEKVAAGFADASDAPPREPRAPVRKGRGRPAVTSGLSLGEGRAAFALVKDDPSEPVEGPMGCRSVATALWLLSRPRAAAVQIRNVFVGPPFSERLRFGAHAVRLFIRGKWRVLSFDDRVP